MRSLCTCFQHNPRRPYAKNQTGQKSRSLTTAPKIGTVQWVLCLIQGHYTIQGIVYASSVHKKSKNIFAHRPEIFQKRPYIPRYAPKNRPQISMTSFLRL